MPVNTRNLRFRSNRVADILSLYHTELDPLYGPHEVTAMAELLFEGLLGWSRTRLLASRQDTIDQSDLLRLHWALEDLLRWRPVQHIVGHTDVCGCHIEVSPDVLTPRPETAQMVQSLATATPHPTRVLDLCTGSGCIAIALKRAWPDAEVTALDISTAALAVARRNAEANQASVEFMHADLLDDSLRLPMGAFDLIVANPPYVLRKEQAAMRRNVLDYEPHEALFVPDNDPLLFYQAIARQASIALSPDGLLAVEVNENQAQATASLLAKAGLHPELHTDFRDNPRWITATSR